APPRGVRLGHRTVLPRRFDARGLGTTHVAAGRRVNFSTNPVISPVIALATWLSLIPLAVLLDGRAHLVEAVLLVAVVGIVGSLFALLGLGRGATYSLQVVAAVAMLVWRGLMLGPPETDFMATFLLLIQEGSATIAASAPP